MRRYPRVPVQGPLFRGPERMRLMTMVVMLGVVGMLIARTRDPRTWRWFASMDEPLSPAILDARDREQCGWKQPAKAARPLGLFTHYQPPAARAGDPMVGDPMAEALAEGQPQGGSSATAEQQPAAPPARTPAENPSPNTPAANPAAAPAPAPPAGTGVSPGTAPAVVPGVRNNAALPNMAGLADDVPPPDATIDPKLAAEAASSSGASSGSTEFHPAEQANPGVPAVKVKELPVDEDPIEREEFNFEAQAIADKDVLRPEEMAAYWRLVDWERGQKFKDMEKRARGDVVFSQFFEKPDYWRGRLVKLNLRINRTTADDANDLGKQRGLARTYQAWGVTQESGTYPYAVMLTQLPGDFPLRTDMQEDVTFVGYFFKLLAYKARDDKFKAVPMLIGKVFWHSNPPVELPFNSNWLWGGGIGVLALVMVAVRLSFKMRPLRPRGLLPPREDGEEAVPIETWLERIEDGPGAGGHHAGGGPPSNRLPVNGHSAGEPPSNGAHPTNGSAWRYPEELSEIPSREAKGDAADPRRRQRRFFTRDRPAFARRSRGSIACPAPFRAVNLHYSFRSPSRRLARESPSPRGQFVMRSFRSRPRPVKPLRRSAALLWAISSCLALLGQSLSEPSWMGPSAALGAEDFARRYDTSFRQLLTKYCVKCHGGEKTEGKLNLIELDTGEKAVAARCWSRVLERVGLKEMPPEGQPTMTDPERMSFFRWAEGVLNSDGLCDKVATDINQHFNRGAVMSRRLSRAEYNNTVRDLTGVDTHPAAAFPADGSGGEGFDTDGAALFTNPILMEKYLSAADAVVEAALPDAADALPPARAAARQRILAAADASGPPRERARRILLAFATRAYRRPAADDDVGPLLGLFDRGIARGDAFLPALRLAMKGVLVSPNFLFLVEPEPDATGVYALGPWPLASRLSYFLWGSMPDDELAALAASGQLTEPETLRAQARRMLASERARGLAESFAAQWLGIGAIGTTVRPDAGRFPEFDEELSAAIKGEPVAMVERVLREDRSLLELIDADYAMLNERLARLYGILDVVGAEFRPVPLKDRTRGGVLGMASVLMATSHPLRTSPVLRGKWILAEVLGGRVPPPPPNVPSLPEDDAPSEGLTLRQRLELHRSRAECRSCHSRMDPLGFGLENFDPLGRWRTDIGGQPVDASGELPNGDTFSGPAELKQALLKRRHDILKNLARKMLGYALGRELNRFDDCVVDGALEALDKNEYRASILIERIVLSFPFSHRYARR